MISNSLSALLANKPITVFAGGDSQEQEVSLKTGRNVCAALERLGVPYHVLDPAKDAIDYTTITTAFIALHGPGYEDGVFQRKLDTYGICYTGSGPAACALAMDKLASKKRYQERHIPHPAYVWLNQGITNLPAGFSFPVVLKPLSEGSSIDVFICDTVADLSAQSQYLAQKYQTGYLLETFIAGREITVGIVAMPEPVVLPILELVPVNRFYDYEAKYTPGKTEFIVPASLTKQEKDAISRLSHTAFLAMGLTGYGRVDCRFCPQKGPFILECNALPGLTETSDLPLQANAHGWSFDTLIAHIVRAALAARVTC